MMFQQNAYQSPEWMKRASVRYTNSLYKRRQANNHDSKETEKLANHDIEKNTESKRRGAPVVEIPYEPTSTHLRLNVGGRSYMLRTANLQKICKGGLLADLAQLEHDLRVARCDEYIEYTQEYFFERSGRLFDTIYKFYATGTLHRPLDVCLQEFVDELAYWQIPDQLLSSCCAPKILQKDDEDDTDLFEGLKGAEWRRKVWSFTEGDGTLLSNIFSFTSIGFVIISITSLIVGSVPACQVPINRTKYHYEDTDPITGHTFQLDEPLAYIKVVFEPHPIFEDIELVCIMWFTFEYILRLCIAPLKLAFMRGTLNMVDAAAILPFYLELTLEMAGIDTEKLEDLKGALLVIRILRVLRVVRILKLGRYSAGMRTFALTLKSSAKQLGMMAMVFATGIIFFSTMVYFMEKDEPSTPFTSIPAGFWWCIVTMTTVGYGDVVPVTTIGKLIGSAAICCGVLVLALPITIIVDNFMKVSGK